MWKLCWGPTTLCTQILQHPLKTKCPEASNAASSILFLTFAMKEIHMDRVANIGRWGWKLQLKWLWHLKVCGRWGWKLQLKWLWHVTVWGRWGWKLQLKWHVKVWGRWGWKLQLKWLWHVNKTWPPNNKWTERSDYTAMPKHFHQEEEEKKKSTMTKWLEWIWLKQVKLHACKCVHSTV